MIKYEKVIGNIFTNDLRSTIELAKTMHDKELLHDIIEVGEQNLSVFENLEIPSLAFRRRLTVDDNPGH